MLQRCLSSRYYYFFDDICTPSYEQILLWEQDEQQKQLYHLRRLLDEEQGKFEHQEGSNNSSTDYKKFCSSSDDDNSNMKHVWTRFIARLNDMQNEYYQKNRDGYWRAFIIWFVLNTFLVTKLVNGEYDYGDLDQQQSNFIMSRGFLCIVFTMIVLNVCPLIVNPQAAGGEEHIIQNIVDNTTQEFDDLGYHIDLVKRNSNMNLLHPDLYIRITQIGPSKPTTTTKTMNQTKLYQYQQQALFDYQDWLLLKNQEQRLIKKEEEKKQSSSSSDDRADDPEIIFCGDAMKIRMTTLLSWKPIIIIMTVCFGFIYFTSMFMNFAGMIFYTF